MSLFFYFWTLLVFFCMVDMLYWLKMMIKETCQLCSKFVDRIYGLNLKIIVYKIEKGMKPRWSLRKYNNGIKKKKKLFRALRAESLFSSSPIPGPPIWWMLDKMRNSFYRSYFAAVSLFTFSSYTLVRYLIWLPESILL